MRLLHTRTLQLHEFHGDQIPTYGILSHRWEEEEVTFEDMNKWVAGSKKGWRKIKKFCAQAREWDLDYVWVDTCCIDKSSSAQLSEAINSMYRWYRKSRLCFVYLSDVHNTGTRAGLSREFKQSKWFTRGWTLQELIAPTALYFFDSSWTNLGPRWDFDAEICAVTGVKFAGDIYSDWNRPSPSPSIARRMSWAAGRKTTREEDMAYCLLGLFHVNMPLLYGEGGKKAFLRLQLEILKESDDESIFAWSAPDIASAISPASGLLAESPACFAGSGDIQVWDGANFINRSPYAMSNKGLQIKLNMEKFLPDPHGPVCYRAPLNCNRRDEWTPISIFLLKLPAWLAQHDETYLRFGPLVDGIAFESNTADGTSKKKNLRLDSSVGERNILVPQLTDQYFKTLGQELDENGDLRPLRRPAQDQIESRWFTYLKALWDFERPPCLRDAQS